MILKKQGKSEIQEGTIRIHYNDTSWPKGTEDEHEPEKTGSPGALHPAAVRGARLRAVGRGDGDLARHHREPGYGRGGPGDKSRTGLERVLRFPRATSQPEDG